MKYEPPVLITGTKDARVKFDKSLTGILGAQGNAVVVDTALVSSVYRSDCAQRIAIIISCVEDIRHVIQLLQLQFTNADAGVERQASNGEQLNTTDSQEKAESESRNDMGDLVDNTISPSHTGELSIFHNRILIAGCVSSLKDRCAIRMLALRMGCVGVLLSQANGTHRPEAWGDSKKSQSANVIFGNVIASWSSGDDERTLDAWGDAYWSQETDIIIPPGWDSIPKIRAVADAFGAAFDQISEEGRIPSLSSGENVPSTDALDSESLPDHAQENSSSFPNWRKKHTQWIALMDEKLQKGISPKDDRSTTDSSVNHTDKRRSDGDFFQRLLTSHQ